MALVSLRQVLDQVLFLLRVQRLAELAGQQLSGGITSHRFTSLR